MTIALCLGVFIGNWLIVPFLCNLFYPERLNSYSDGFWVGLIAAVLVAILSKIFNL